MEERGRKQQMYDIDYLHDFRQDIVKKKRDKKYWKNWDTWNILYKTLAYELSSSRDVESYEDVKTQVFEYFPDYSKYIKGTATLDIMNGWWFCFKYLFGLDEKANRGGTSTKEYLLNLNASIKDFNKESDLIKFICKNNGIKEEYIKSLLDFLKVVYTIGNITPININSHADCFDSWEYKLFVSDSVKYIKGYEKYFLYDGYYKEQRKWGMDFRSSDDKEKVILEYMNSRIDLIKERGKILANREGL